MGQMFRRVGSASLTLALAFVLSYAILISLAMWSPITLNWMLDGADMVEDALTQTQLPDRYNNLVRILVSDEQILFVFFAIIARIVIAIVGSSFSAAISPRR